MIPIIFESWQQCTSEDMGNTVRILPWIYIHRLCWRLVTSDISGIDHRGRLIGDESTQGWFCEVGLKSPDWGLYDRERASRLACDREAIALPAFSDVGLYASD
jgi:hypothetical protein